MCVSLRQVFPNPLADPLDPFAQGLRCGMALGSQFLPVGAVRTLAQHLEVRGGCAALHAGDLFPHFCNLTRARCRFRQLS